MDIKILASSSKGNCYRVSDGNTSLLLECGITFKKIQQGLNFKTSELEGCLITHEHKDHCAAVKDLLKRGIKCYMSQGTKEALEIDSDSVIIIENQKPFYIGTWKILPFDVQHDVAEPLGFLLMNKEGEKLLFATDTYYIKYKFTGLTHVMLECNYSKEILEHNVQEGIVEPFLKDRIIKSHFSLENVKTFFEANDLTNLQEIYLLHLSGDNSNPEHFKQEVSKVTGKPVFVER